MNKSELKEIFINAKKHDARYIGVKIQTEGSSQPEIIINPRENFDAKFEYYMQAYDDDLVLISAKGKKDIRITGTAQGNTFEDIEIQLTLNNQGWIPCEEKYPDTSEYILLSFENFTVPLVGRYEEDENGGAFYVGDETESCASQDIIVNAWKLLPVPYKSDL